MPNEIAPLWDTAIKYSSPSVEISDGIIMVRPFENIAGKQKKAAHMGDRNEARQNGLRDFWSGAPVPQQAATGKKRGRKEVL